MKCAKCGHGTLEPGVVERTVNVGELSYTAEVEGADRPIYFSGKGYFLRKSFYVGENPENPEKRPGR